MNNNLKIWDVVVVGGGPAGMMAAGRAGERKKAVLLLEKNTSLGKKLLITGGGRCNLTNYKTEMSELVSCYGDKHKALFSIFSQYDSLDTISFFESRGLKTKIEPENRVFPITDKAESVWEILLSYLKENKVKISTNREVKEISIDGVENLIKIKTSRGNELTRSCILSTGGISYPETGSTGDGFRWLDKLGHSIIDNSLALVPIKIKEDWVKRLAGLAFKDVRISIFQDEKQKYKRNGKILFTHFGLSGPTILNMSSKIRELIKRGKVIIELDLFPYNNHAEVKKNIDNLLLIHSNKKIKNILDKILAKSIIPTLLDEIKLDKDKYGHSISKEERMRIVHFVKSIKLEVGGLLGRKHAIVSSGGVDINEINFKTMESKICPNIYIVGDLVNIDRPSGGYSLQLCWSMGYVAGSCC